MNPFQIHEPNPRDSAAALVELGATVRQHRALATQANASLKAATPTLVAAIRSGSGQGHSIEELLWSTWNGENKAGLCDCLTGLDPNIAVAALAMLTARTHMGGDADTALRHIIIESGSQPREQNSPTPIS